MQHLSLSVFQCHKRQVHAVAFRQLDIVRSNFVDERRDDRKFARLEAWVTRLDARTAATIEDLSRESSKVDEICYTNTNFDTVRKHKT